MPEVTDDGLDNYWWLWTIIFIGTAISDDISNLIIAQLLFLQAEDAEKDVSIYINSPGGTVTAGMAIYDTIQFLRCDVATYCVGQAASMGAVLLAAGVSGGAGRWTPRSRA